MSELQTTAAGFRARRFCVCLSGLAVLLGAGSSLADVASEPAPLAAQALLLDVARAGEKLVAVGDHGLVVLSRDNGRTWAQSLTPTRALLTGVSFPDAQHGWAVGHEGVILHTGDGGLTWQRQDDGHVVENVYLDVLFIDPLHGFVVGAYGKFLATEDGGKTWQPGHPSRDEVHYNRISHGPDGWLYLSGESGTTLVSQDGGKNWSKSEVPYDGSLFGVLPLGGGRILTYGLRGHILRSEDHGAVWEPVNNAVQVLIMGGIRLQNGAIILAGQGGNFFISRDSGRSFKPWKPDGFGTSVADLIEAGDGFILTVGEAGAVRLKLP
jgi:photosystem II stability/assembly factor-like uncharacterized protein